jgi:hypothetical protein
MLYVDAWMRGCVECANLRLCVLRTRDCDVSNSVSAGFGRAETSEHAVNRQSVNSFVLDDAIAQGALVE